MGERAVSVQASLFGGMLNVSLVDFGEFDFGRRWRGFGGRFRRGNGWGEILERDFELFEVWRGFWRRI